MPAKSPDAGAVTAAPPAAAQGTAAPPGSPTLAAATATPASATPGTAPGAAPAAIPGQPPGPPPFAAVVRNARRIDGPLTMWQREDKVWIELTPAQLNQPFLLSPKIKSGIGEAWVLGGLMAFPINGAGGPQVVEFVRIHNQVRLQARNMEVIAAAGTPEARAVADSYSHSLLGAAPLASQPHPDRKSVLVEANALFLGDMLGIGMMLQRSLRQGYGLDRANSVITAARGTEQATILETEQHFYTPSVGIPPPNMPPGLPGPAVPRFVPDARSLLVGLHYSLAPLPDRPMAPRRADPRVGTFTTTVLDFSNDLGLNPRQRFVNRWRLEKKDPAAERSEPVKPITFWIDRNVPLQYRETVRAGILEWNRAFEKIGFVSALRVEQQPDDAPWDTLDFGVASVRWMMNAEPAFGAIGPSHVDPRSGEILDADIAFEGMSARAVRGVRAQVLGPRGAAAAADAAAGPAPVDPGMFFATPFAQPMALPGGTHDPFGHDHARCLHGALAAEQLGYALDVLAARDELPPDSPIAQQFVLDYIKESIMHEVGHALGLRHNFRASRAYSEAQLADPEFTRAHGVSGSVMEYNAVNLSAPGERAGMPFQTVLGPYDFWAVEYAYKPLPPGTDAASERAELQRIAARNSEPQLAFGTDEDIFAGLDPEIIQLDLGDDPIAFATKRLAIARDLFRRQETRALPPDRDYAVLRRSLGYAIGDATRAIGVLARQIGGMRTLRDFPGSGRDPLQPVDAQVQRVALDLIATAVLSPEGLSLSPALQRRLAPDYLDRADSFGQATDFALPQRLLDLQRAVLAYLMSDAIAARIVDSASKLDDPAQALQLAEVHARLSAEVWGDLERARSVPAMRRELQREHVNRVALALLRPSPAARVDARSLMQTQGRALLTRLERAQQRPGLDADTRAHLADAADTLKRAIAAPLLRQGL
ncbi:MAG: zinc-dependent metalloprotease [Rubrivivax sp.]|nr:zinc-dependent metalloprotease [Rubrivivax sp.]